MRMGMVWAVGGISNSRDTHCHPPYWLCLSILCVHPGQKFKGLLWASTHCALYSYSETKFFHLTSIPVPGFLNMGPVPGRQPFQIGFMKNYLNLTLFHRVSLIYLEVSRSWCKGISAPQTLNSFPPFLPINRFLLSLYFWNQMCGFTHWFSNSSQTPTEWLTSHSLSAAYSFLPARKAEGYNQITWWIIPSLASF